MSLTLLLFLCVCVFTWLCAVLWLAAHSEPFPPNASSSGDEYEQLGGTAPRVRNAAGENSTNG